MQDNNDKALQQVTEDIQRYADATRWVEEVNFRADSGFNLDTIYRRVMASVNRCFKQGTRVRNDLGWTVDSLPAFHPQCRVRINIELLGPDEHPTLATKGKDQRSTAEVSKG